METAHLTEAMLKNDAFQIEGLRTNLAQKHTYWDRSATNYNIIETASRIVKEKKKKGKEGQRRGKRRLQPRKEQRKGDGSNECRSFKRSLDQRRHGLERA